MLLIKDDEPAKANGSKAMSRNSDRARTSRPQSDQFASVAEKGNRHARKLFAEQSVAHWLVGHQTTGTRLFMDVADREIATPDPPHSQKQGTPTNGTFGQAKEPCSAGRRRQQRLLI